MKVMKGITTVNLRKPCLCQKIKLKLPNVSFSLIRTLSHPGNCVTEWAGGRRRHHQTYYPPKLILADLTPTAN